MPEARTSSSASQMRARTSGASPSVASSRISRRGLVIRARPMASICCSPPDSSDPMAAERSASSGNSACTRSRVQPSPEPSAGGRAVAIRFSCTVRVGKIWRPSGTSPRPRRARAWGGRRVTSRPDSRTDPARAGSRPVSTFTVVVLPIPLRPSSVTHSPASTRRSTPKSTCADP